MTSERTELAANLARVRERIDRAASRSARHPEDITLIAVSKTKSAAQIRALYDAGVRHFGENRIQEREAKLGHLSDLDATWHMIGHLQSNKSAKAVRLFDTVDSLDSVALAERLDRGKKDFNTEVTEGSEKNREERKGSAANPTAPLRVLIEVKLDPGESKSGIRAEDLALLVHAVLPLPHLNLRGLMGVPPYFDDAEQARPYFRRLRQLRDAIRAETGNHLLPVLSMGMSHDFEVAIEEGATEIRIGTALFGEREKA